MDTPSMGRGEVGGEEPPAGAKLALEILRSAPELQLATLRVGEKRKIAAAFASLGLPVLGQAFDAVSVLHVPGRVLSFADENALRQQAKHVELIEIKATARASIPDDFTGFFFAITTGEMLAAQKLGVQYRFALVHLVRGTYRLYSLADVMHRLKAIYPTWSVVMGPSGPGT